MGINEIEQAFTINDLNILIESTKNNSPTRKNMYMYEIQVLLEAIS